MAMHRVRSWVGSGIWHFESMRVGAGLTGRRRCDRLKPVGGTIDERP
jgi:hypothetical protein